MLVCDHWGEIAMNRTRAGWLVAIAAFLPCQAQPISRGEILASQCFSCHRSEGGTFQKIPRIGTEAEHIIEEMSEFKSGEHEGTLMGRIARGYTDEEIRLIADFLGGPRRGRL
jgi:sulfide dehydrogenase cytochrome subunit